jgi:hypothetical protein
VPAPPAEGRYTFDRHGFVKSSTASYADAEAALPQSLDGAVYRDVSNVSTRSSSGSADPEITYDVTQAEGRVSTTTTYVIRPDDGVYIQRIVTQATDLPGSPTTSTGTESFSPQPAIKVVDLPLAVQAAPGSQTNADQSGQGVDPLTGVYMENYFQTVGRTTVLGCSETIDAWRVDVNAGAFRRPRVRTFAFRGSFAFAPQLGLIVSDDIELYDGVDEYRGTYFHQRTTSVVDSSRPVHA